MSNQQDKPKASRRKFLTGAAAATVHRRSPADIRITCRRRATEA